MINDPRIYLGVLQQAAREQDRAQFATFTSGFAKTLERLPSIAGEIKRLLTSDYIPGSRGDFLGSKGVPIDYIALIHSTGPHMKSAEAFLAALDAVPWDLRGSKEVSDYEKARCASLSLNTVSAAKDRFDAFFRDTFTAEARGGAYCRSRATGGG